MSKEIDEKVVQMRFDNSNFESNVQTSLGTISRLKQSLNFSDSSKSLENIGAAAKSVNMSPLSNAVETVKMKFSALEVMAITALSNITNSAVNAGKRLISALTIDPIKDGFSEYETQMNAIQTIMANTESKGSTMDDVNKALDELNTYADKTIYNFSEMTRNIGTFTAAGVGLNESVNAIKGIANLAAVSGSTSQQASTAMYQLSQALATGRVALQDWNSVVNAGMGGELFQNALKRTAENMGTNVDAMIEKYGSFRESLTQGGWLTSEVLTETLSQLSGAYTEADLLAKGYSESQVQEIMDLAKTAEEAATKVKTFTQLWDTLKEAAGSGWAKTWQIIVGNFEEARDVLTSVSDTLSGFINKSADARNKVLSDWKDLGGRADLIASIKNIFEGLLSVIKPVKEAFSEVFESISGADLAKFTESFKNLTENFKLSETTSNNLKRTFSGLFSIIDILKEAFLALGKAISPLGSFIGTLFDTFLSVTAVLGDYVSGIAEAIDKSDLFGTIIKDLKTVFKPFGDVLNNVVDKIKEFFNGLKTIDSSSIDSMAEKMTNGLKPFTTMSETIKKVFDNLFQSAGQIVNKVVEIFKKIGSALVDGLNLPALDNLFSFVNGGLMSGIIYGLKKIIDNLSDLSEGGGFLAPIKDSLDAVKNCLKAYQTEIKSKTLIKIASAIAILAGSLLLLSMIEPGKLTASLAAMATLIGELMGSMLIFDKISSGSKFKGITKVAISMILLSTAILILSSAMKSMSDLNWNEIAKGLVSVAGMAAVLVASSKFMSGSSGKMISTAAGLVIFAEAIKILGDAVIKLGNLDVNTLIKGLVSVGTLCAELAIFLKVSDLDGMGLLKGLGIMALAEAIVILSKAVDKFGQMDTNALIKGLVGVGAVLAELAVFANVTGNASKIISTAVGMTILASAMLILAKAVDDMGNLSWEQIGKGLLTMAGGLTAMTLALNLMPTGVFSKSVGMVLFASSLLILGNAIEQMGNLSWGQIGKGMVTLAGSLTILVVALNMMTAAIPGALAMIIAAGAITILANAMTTLGDMTWGEIAKSLVMLAGAFVVIGASALLLTPVLPLIALLGAAVALLGVGCLAAGAGVLAFSTALVALAGVGSAGIQVIIDLVKGLLDLIPTFIAKIGEGIIAFAQVIIDGAPVIAQAITTVITEVCGMLSTCIPTIVNMIVEMLLSLIQTIASYIPQFAKAGADIIIGFIDGLSENIPRIAESGMNLIRTFLNGISTFIPEVVDAGMTMIIDLINGMADAISSNTPLLVSAMQNLINSIIDAGVALLTGSVGTFLSKGGELIGGLINGIKGKVGDVISAVSSIISSCKDALSNVASEFVSIGSDIISGLVSGIKSGLSSVASAISDVASSAVEKAKSVLGIASPSKEFAEIGMYSDKGLAKGLIKYSNVVTKAAGNVANNMLDVMNDSISKISVDGLNSQPTIRPVFDMSSIEEGANAINGLFAKQQTVSLGIQNGGNINAISNAMRGGQVVATNDDVVQAIDSLKKVISGNAGNSYTIDGITYDDGSNISNAVKSIIRAAKVERRR